MKFILNELSVFPKTKKIKEKQERSRRSGRRRGADGWKEASVCASPIQNMRDQRSFGSLLRSTGVHITKCSMRAYSISTDLSWEKNIDALIVRQSVTDAQKRRRIFSFGFCVLLLLLFFFKDFDWQRKSYENVQYISEKQHQNVVNNSFLRISMQKRQIEVISWFLGRGIHEKSHTLEVQAQFRSSSPFRMKSDTRNVN